MYICIYRIIKQITKPSSSTNRSAQVAVLTHLIRCICIYICVYMNEYALIYLLCIYMCVFINILTYINIYMHIFIYTYICIYIYLYISVYIYIYIYIFNLIRDCLNDMSEKESDWLVETLFDILRDPSILAVPYEDNVYFRARLSHSFRCSISSNLSEGRLVSLALLITRYVHYMCICFFVYIYIKCVYIHIMCRHIRELDYRIYFDIPYFYNFLKSDWSLSLY
jgi:hypothetical protein